MRNHTGDDAQTSFAHAMNQRTCNDALVYRICNGAQTQSEMTGLKCVFRIAALTILQQSFRNCNGILRSWCLALELPGLEEPFRRHGSWRLDGPQSKQPLIL